MLFLILKKLRPRVIHSQGTWYCLMAGYMYKKEGNAALKPIALSLGLWALTSAANVGINQIRNYATGREPDPAWDWVLGAMFGNTFLVRDVYGTVTSKLKYGFSGGSSMIPADEIINGSVDAAYMLITSSGINGGEFDLERFIKGWSVLGGVAAKTTGTPISIAKYGIDISMAHGFGDDEWKEEWPIGNR